jgi:hypothetical protein
MPRKASPRIAKVGPGKGPSLCVRRDTGESLDGASQIESFRIDAPLRHAPEPFGQLRDIACTLEEVAKALGIGRQHGRLLSEEAATASRTWARALELAPAGPTN